MNYPTPITDKASKSSSANTSWEVVSVVEARKLEQQMYAWQDCADQLAHAGRDALKNSPAMATWRKLSKP